MTDIFKEMIFKGKKVFVQVDGSGELLLDKGRAVMKYRQEDDRVYNPWPANLSSNTGESFALAPPSAAQKKTSPKQKKPAPKSGPIPENAIVAYTDGGCIGNPGPAGVGYVISYPDGKKVQQGEPIGEGTNNIAELTAIGRVLEIVSEKTQTIVIHTDSSYAIGVLTKGWKAKANPQLISSIRKLLDTFSDVRFVKVKGHAGIPDNELVDDLARTAAQTQKLQE